MGVSETPSRESGVAIARPARAVATAGPRGSLPDRVETSSTAAVLALYGSSPTSGSLSQCACSPSASHS